MYVQQTHPTSPFHALCSQRLTNQPLRYIVGDLARLGVCAGSGGSPLLMSMDMTRVTFLSGLGLYGRDTPPPRAAVWMWRGRLRLGDGGGLLALLKPLAGAELTLASLVDLPTPLGLQGCRITPRPCDVQGRAGRLGGSRFLPASSGLRSLLGSARSESLFRSFRSVLSLIESFLMVFFGLLLVLKQLILLNRLSVALLGGQRGLFSAVT